MKEISWNHYLKRNFNLLIKINEEHKKKQDIKNILNGNNQIIKSSNHSVIDLINNSKQYNLIFLISFY